MTMRKKANISLFLLALLFVIAAICVYVYPDVWWSRMLLYTAEAGLVGALADLFAVTVLFRHPFGLSWVPHTAIIPRNRDKLVEGVVKMVEEQLLGKGMLKEKLSEVNIVEALIKWFDKLPSESSIGTKGWELLVGLLRNMNIHNVASQLDQHLRTGLKGINLAPYSGKALRWLLRHVNLQKWLGYIVEYASKRASTDETKEAIRALLNKEKNKFVNEGGSISRWFKQKLVDFAESSNAINLDEATETMFRDMQTFLQDLEDPKHELRQLIENKLYELADHLENNENVSIAIEEWKLEMFEQLSLQPSIQALLGTVKEMLVSDGDLKYVVMPDRAVHTEDIKQWIVGLIQSFWESFKSDEGTKNQLEGYLKQFIAEIIEQEHTLIGKIVRKTLDGFTEERLVHFIESKVETDLQRIRLNGAFIGAAVGALLYLFLHGVYAPFLEMF
ncbi:DUF445 domain-containing protein [Paenibacillus sp. GSMTC-2017]|uniref:DUF445 domain-containing protein n=1 Tax=Paenibacillus sp. GSMTC-2017 TaxID=2794350 RepID=UPI0018D7A561|nr:DUF445 domain-containing protein [Paenibacillus sp. GSMTC-2017]MBH5317050.1 DUF445 domain-containing protein [Paenibacillus sp. GSMTC-2017]